MSEWISVSERLPEYDDELVLVCGHNIEPYTTVMVDEKTEGRLGIEVTHWMPLPDPPKEA